MSTMTFQFWLRLTLLLTGGASASAAQWPSIPYDGFEVQRWRTPPAYQPENIFAVKAWPVGVKRVAVLPVATVLADVPAEFVAVTRAELLRWTGRMSFSTAYPLPPDLLARIMEHTGAEAVAFLEVTHFSPYGSQTIGLRGRIMELAPNRAIWAFEETIQADEAGTAQMFREGLGRQDHLLSANSSLAGIRISPVKIVAYVARVLVKTLPPRQLVNFSP